MIRRCRTAAVLALVVTGCSSPPDGFQAIPASDVPFQLGASSTASTSGSASTSLPAAAPEGIVVDTVDLFFVANETLVRVQRLVAGSVSPSSALELLASGPVAEAGLAGLRSAIPGGFAPNVRVIRGVALVDLGEVRLESLSPVDQRLFVAQIVLTLTSRNGVGQVVFSVGGDPIAVPRGRGDLVEPLTPVTYDDYAGMVAGS
ncbi:MAG: GerMN domain-containing protein [Acidobacteria bacterium]|nr:GerMN domain-containing protein [Acidobacteriota bacterium]